MVLIKSLRCFRYWLGTKPFSKSINKSYATLKMDQSVNIYVVNGIVTSCEC